MNVCDRCLNPECARIVLSIDRQHLGRNSGRPNKIAKGQHWLCERCKKTLIRLFKDMITNFIAEGRDPDLLNGQDPTPERTSIFARPGRHKGR